MQTLIENYRNLTAGHCGSGAMRNLLFHYSGLELGEGVVFGLGAGLDCLFFSVPGVSPPYMLFGRGISMEQDVATNLGIDYREAPQPDEALAWQEVRDEVLAGRPTMLSGDIFYLDYREYTVHFPGHRFVLLGFDDARQEVYIADRTESETQTCSMEALRLSRNPPEGISTLNMWGKFHDGEAKHALPEACERALRMNVPRMLGTDPSQGELMQMSLQDPATTVRFGLDGIQALAEAIPGWPEADDPGSYAGYLVNAIIKFGTGGACFRSLYAEFLAWARQQRPELVSENSVKLAEQSSGQWLALSELAAPLIEDGTNRDAWLEAQQRVLAIHRTERALFEGLAEALE